MRVQVANFWHIWDALGALEIAQAEYGRPLDINPEDENSAKLAFQRHVKPWVNKWPAERVEEFKVSLAYFMNNEFVLDDRVLGSLQDLAMDQPKDVCRFFRWLWESLFPGQNWMAIDLRGVKEKNDVMATNRSPF
jgi:hypothetical protein